MADNGLEITKTENVETTENVAEQIEFANREEIVYNRMEDYVQNGEDSLLKEEELDAVLNRKEVLDENKDGLEPFDGPTMGLDTSEANGEDVSTVTTIEKTKEVDYGIYKIVTDNIISFDGKNMLSVPTMPYEDYDRYIENAGRMSTEFMETNEKANIAALTNFASMSKSVGKVNFKNFKKEDRKVLERNDIKVMPRHLPIIAKDKKNRVMSMVNNLVKGGQDVQMPLVNTGIQITVGLPSNTELYAFRKELKDMALDKEINSGGFLFNSTKSDITNKILDFCFKYIRRTTLNIPLSIRGEFTNLTDEGREYLKSKIDPFDYPAIMNSIGIGLYPNGNYTTVTCKNTTNFVVKKDPKINKDFTYPKCDFTAVANINIKDAFVVKDNRITDFMFSVLSKRKDYTVEIEEYEQYQKERMSFVDFDNTVTFNNGSQDIKFVFENTNLTRYCRLNDLYSIQVNQMLAGLGQLTGDERERNINNITEINKLVIYNSYVSKIIAGDDVIDLRVEDLEEEAENVELLNEILLAFNNDDETLNLYLSKLVDFLSYSIISGFALNNFSCPTCNEEQTTDDEFIWLDPINYFLEILDYKFMNIVED